MSISEPIADGDNVEASREKKMLNIHLLDSIILSRNTINTIRIRVAKELNNKTLMMLNSEHKNKVVSANVLTKVSDNQAIVNIVNLNNEKIELMQGTKLCHAMIMEEEQVRVLNITESKNKGEKKLPLLTEKDIDCKDGKIRDKLLRLLNKYRDTCWLEGESLGLYRGDPLEINLKENVVVNKPPYRIPHSRQGKLNDTIKNLLEEGVISRSKSSFNSPLIIVGKPDGSIRPCIDYRELNKITDTVEFPIPRISDLLNSLGETKIITSLDLASAYYQCPIKEEDRHKTAFTVGNTKYEYNRVPFGLCSAPGYFSRIINETLYDVLGVQVLSYLDDILVFSKNQEEHLERLEDVLIRLKAANIKLKIKKCYFFTDEVKFLGFIISPEGMKMDKNRVKAINDMPNPINKKQLQSFLGVCNYYRIFIAEFAKLADPLYNLLRKNVKFDWKKEQDEAIIALKESLSTTPILRYPDFTKPFVLHTDASLTGIGACLMQLHEGLLHPIIYVSKCLSETQRKYSTTKRETLALVFGLEQFRHLIWGYCVHVYTDHFPLLGILAKNTKDACLTRWALLVQDYKVNVHYLPGKENILADALSRLTDKGESGENIPNELENKLIERVNLCNELESFIPEKVPWTEEELREEQKSDENVKYLRKQLKEGSNKKLLNFKVIKNMLFSHRTLNRGDLTEECLVPVIPNSLIKKAFKVIHEEATAGHKGYERTLKIFRRNFYHCQESKVIKQMVESCPQCIKSKGIPKPIPIEKYPIPDRPFHSISSDILGPLPISARNKRYVIVFRDFTTRYTVLASLEHKSTECIIDALRGFISNYGSAEVLITDNAPEYTSEKLKLFLNYYNTKKVEIAPYHAASQGLVERINREVNKLLRIYTNEIATVDWDELLPVIQLTINNTHNASIGETPFFVLYGYDSPTITLTRPKINYNESDVNMRLSRISLIRNHCKEELLKSQSKYTDYTNQGKNTKEIKIGMRVFARLDKHVVKKKLDYPIMGPFMVTDKKGRAFKLKSLSSQETFLVHPDSIIVGQQSQIGEEARSQGTEEKNSKRYNLRPRTESQ